MSTVTQMAAKARSDLGGRRLESCVRRAIKAIFRQGVPGLRRVYFPATSAGATFMDGYQLVILPPDRSLRAARISFRKSIGARQNRGRDRTLIQCVPVSTRRLYAAGRKVLAWERVRRRRFPQRGSSSTARLVHLKLGEARRDLQEAVWRSYNTVWLLKEGGPGRVIDLGEIHSPSADTLAGLILHRLLENGHLPLLGLAESMI